MTLDVVVIKYDSVKTYAIFSSTSNGGTDLFYCFVYFKYILLQDFFYNGIILSTFY